MLDLHSTICAISTPPGVGGIAVIRVSGPEAVACCDRYFSKDVETIAPYSTAYGEWRDDDTLVDEVMLTRFVAPRSFTGEDVIEIAVHGSSYIQGECLRLLIAAGCRSAGPGEFTQRAFLNGKMDLSQAEGVADLIASESAAGHRLAMQQMKGRFGHEINGLRQQLIDFASLIELELDFSEEDVEFADRTEFRRLIDTLSSRVGQLRESFKLGNVIKNGVPVAIIGPPNSGKSTLLNALLEDDRAIVSDIAGTTRDAIEDTVIIKETTFRFIDTAGLRETADVIENQGIDIALKKAAAARLVIKLQDAEQLDTPAESRLYRDYFVQIGWEDDDRTLIVYNKIDRLEDVDILPEGSLGISAKAGFGLDALKNELLDRLEIEGLSAGDVIVSNARHHEALGHVQQALGEVSSALDKGVPGDLMAIDIRKALHHLGELTGTITSDDLLGNIFSRFCIGK